jgi:hypothetical protein
MHDIMDALNSEQLESTKYDFITNSCAAGLLVNNMMRHLGIDATARTIITFVSHHLSNDFIPLKHCQTNVGVEEFVSTYIHDHF